MGERSFSDRIAPNEHINEELKSHEITEGEIKMMKEELVGIDSEHQKSIDRLIEESRKDDFLKDLSSETLGKMARMVAGYTNEKALYALARKYGQELSEILGVDEEAISQYGGADARYYFDWLDGNGEFSFSSSDLETDPETGTSRATVMKTNLENYRKKGINKMRAIYEKLEQRQN
jgi:hypothetical protein